MEAERFDCLHALLSFEFLPNICLQVGQFGFVGEFNAQVLQYSDRYNEVTRFQQFLCGLQPGRKPPSPAVLIPLRYSTRH